MSTSPTLAYLDQLYPGVALIHVIQAGLCLSFAPQTTRNKLSQGTFPIETFMLGGKRVVRKTDLAAFIDQLASKRRRGRPTKAEAAALAASRGLS